MTIADQQKHIRHDDDEQQAIRVDAVRHLAELRAVRDVLLPDADDPMVLSELTVIDSEITSAERQLKDLDGHDAATTRHDTSGGKRHTPRAGIRCSSATYVTPQPSPSGARAELLASNQARECLRAS